MNYLNRLIPWVSAAFILAFFQILLMRSDWIFWTLALSELVIFISIWQLTGLSLKKIKFWNFLITPVLFLVAAWLFLMFLDNQFFSQVLVIIIAGVVLLFLIIVFLYFRLRPKYQVYSLENISSYLNLATIFLIFSGIFNLSIFLNYPLWLVVVLSFAVVLLLTHQAFWVNEINLRARWLHALIITLLIEEVFMAVKFLPTSVYVNGLIMAVVYYLLSGLSRNWLLGIQEFKVVRRYLLNSLICLIIILLTAKWI